MPQGDSQGDIERGVPHLEDVHNDYGGCKAGEVASECAAGNERKSKRSRRIIHYRVEEYLIKIYFEVKANSFHNILQRLKHPFFRSSPDRHQSEHNQQQPQLVLLNSCTKIQSVRSR